MPNQSKWPLSRRLYYADMMRQRRTWEAVPTKTAQSRRAVKYNKIQTGEQSAPVLAIRRLIYQTNQVLKVLE
jgi:hypothetical protein